jgi:hypothetical protein
MSSPGHPTICEPSTSRTSKRTYEFIVSRAKKKTARHVHDRALRNVLARIRASSCLRKLGGF